MKYFIGMMMFLLGSSIVALDNAEAQNQLVVKEVTVGEGVTAEKGKTVKVHYTGWLDNNGEPGKKFDSSVDRGTPFAFNLGAKQVIAGWEQGVEGMKVGGKRRLIIPPSLGYGDRPVGPIPAGSTLIFDVELLGVE